MAGPVHRADIEAAYPLSPMQQGMLFHTLSNPAAELYFEQLVCTLTGDLDVAAFHRAIQEVAGRHPVLRTSFVWKRIEKMVQVVHRQAAVPLAVEDWSSLADAEQQARLEVFLADDRKRGFVLSQAPLVRCALLHTGQQRHTLVWSHHHLLLDGWSFPIVISEVLSLYEGYRAGTAVSLPPARQYREYIAWLQAQDVEKAAQYWRACLGDVSAPTPLCGRGPARSEDPARSQETMVLSRTETAAAQAFVRQQQLTLNALLQAAWALLLHRYTGEESVLYGYTVAGRPASLPGAERIVGLCINTLPARVAIRAGATALSLLRQVQEIQLEQQQYEYSPLVLVQGFSGIPRSEPLFESIVVFENYPMESAVRRPSGSIVVSNVRTFEKTNYPVTVVSGPADEWPLTIAYDAARLEPYSIRAMLRALARLIVEIVARPDRRLEDIPLHSIAERRELLEYWQRSMVTESAPVRCVHHEFERVARRQPHLTAVISGGETVTYGELNAAANRLAHRLLQERIGRGSIVGIYMDRSIAAITALLAVLKTGAGFIPIDSLFPAGRASTVFRGARAQLVIGDRDLIAGLDRDAIPRLSYEDLELGPDCPADPVVHMNHVHDLAYVIFTSGSTGEPKGVMIEHGNLTNLVRFWVRDWKLTEESRVLQFASLCFDAAVGEIFPALSAGAAVVVASPDARTPQGLRRLLDGARVTHMTLAPSLLREIALDADKPDDAEDTVSARVTGFGRNLEVVASIGEVCPLEVARWWSARVRAFYNGYGPTEGTIASAWYKVASDAAAVSVDRLGFVPFGGPPLDGVDLYVLEEHSLEPVGVGMQGELCLGGLGVARGYMGRPDLTAERFLPDPFGNVPGGRLYRTGDRVRVHAGGLLESRGRTDQQMKLRGFRMEAAEIEGALLLAADTMLKDAAVVVIPGKEILAAYCVLRQNGVQENMAGYIDRLRNALGERLPSYMVPSLVVLAETMPLLPVSGKKDRTRILEICAARAAQETEDRADRTAAEGSSPEEVLGTLWQAVLGLSSRPGRDDDFQALGGHSLKITQLASRLHEAFGVSVPLPELFKRTTLHEQARYVAELIHGAGAEGAGALSRPSLNHAARANGSAVEYPLSFAQQRLWFIHQLDPADTSYNIASLLRLEGPLDTGALRNAFRTVIARHEVLRSRIVAVPPDLEPRVQVVPAEQWLDELAASGGLLPVREYAGTRDQMEQDIRQEMECRFSLADGPLLRANLMRAGEQEHLLLLVVHHSVADGWSMEVLLRELSAAYIGTVRGAAPHLRDLQIQYGDYARWQREVLAPGSPFLEAGLAYWKEQLDGMPPLLDLPTDRPRPSMRSGKGGLVQASLPAGLQRRVDAHCLNEGVTPFMFMLAVYVNLLARYSGQRDVAVGTPVAGRTHASTEELIGFFVNSLVIRIRLSSLDNFRTLLKKVRTACLGAYAHQEIPFERLVEEMQPHRNLSYSPLFQAAFTLQNKVRLSIPGINVTPLERAATTAKYDLTFTVAEAKEGMTVYAEYASDLFDAATVRRMLDHYVGLVEQATICPEERLENLSLLRPEERAQIIGDWNAPLVDAPAHTCVHSWFESEAGLHPEAPALLWNQGCVTYSELNRRAARLAALLRRRGIRTECRVGLFFDRCPEMVVALLAVLKSGGAFVPLDPSYPEERIAYMIQDAGLSLILSTRDTGQRFASRAVAMHFVDEDPGSDEGPLDRAEGPPPGPMDLAYVIYTSGSTGLPKGVMLQHRGACNLAAAQQRAFRQGSGSRILQFSSWSFDASVWETLMALLSGAALCIVPREALAPGIDLLTTLRSYRITTVTLPPSVLAVLPENDLPDLTTVIAAGERCSADIAERWSRGRSFFNAYGPTETTVCATMYRVPEGTGEAPPIGTPIDNTPVYLLDEAFQPVPVGVGGELCVGGVQVARGYLARPSLTAERFIPDPFSAVPGSRLYRTGDRARFKADGMIEYLGRIDDQVKLRGFRIELGEVEAALKRFPGVVDAAVILREDSTGEQRVAGYVVLPPAASFDRTEIEEGLRKFLPSYMLPQDIVRLDALPLTPAGKIDRRRLPAPTTEERGELVLPRNDTERILASICAELLGREQVGIFDNFFDLGGHSLLATRFAGRIRDLFHVDVPLRVLFERPTVAELAAAIGTAPVAVTASHEADQELLATLGRGNEDLGSLLDEISRLSDDEVQRMVRQEGIDATGRGEAP